MSKVKETKLTWDGILEDVEWGEDMTDEEMDMYILSEMFKEEDLIESNKRTLKYIEGYNVGKKEGSSETQKHMMQAVVIYTAVMLGLFTFLLLV